MALLLELVAGMVVDPDEVIAITNVATRHGSLFAVVITLSNGVLTTAQELGSQDVINEVSRMTSLVNANRTRPKASKSA